MFEKMLSRLFGTKPEEAPMNQTQREALIDALVFAMMADGEMAEEERAELTRSLEGLPWTASTNREVYISAAIVRVEEAKVSRQSADALVADISARLETIELRERAYAQAARIVCSDHDVVDAERGLMSMFIQHFDLDRERAIELSAQAHQEFEVI